MTNSGGGWRQVEGTDFLPASVPVVVPTPVPSRERVASQPKSPPVEPQAEPQPTSGAASSRGRYQSLDLWRGAACLMLVLYHATFHGDYHFRLGDRSTWSWGGLPLFLIRYLWIGVPIFFVISGYCIAASVDSLRKRPFCWKEYCIRRVRRIYPPLWAMCGLAVAFTWTMTRIPTVRAECPQFCDLSALSVWQWAGNLLAAEAWRHNLVGGEPAYLMANTWTLCYEEQFYIVTGVLLAFAPRRFFQATAWLTVAVIAARHVLGSGGLTQKGFFWDGHWVLFAAGILVYRTLQSAPGVTSESTSGWRTWRRGAPVLWLVLGLIYAVVSRRLATDYFERHLAEYLFVGCLFALALLPLRRWDQAIASHWAVAPLRWCGQRSYSIYLTHYLLVVCLSSWLAYGGLRTEWQTALIVVPVCALASLPVAILFYECIERRFSNRTQRA